MRREGGRAEMGPGTEWRGGESSGRRTRGVAMASGLEGKQTGGFDRLNRASRRRTTAVGLRLVALRVPRTTRAARQLFPFRIGRRARSRRAGPSGPRPLAPPRLRTRRRASGMMAASRGPSGPLRGSPLPRGHTASWFGTAQPVEGRLVGKTRRSGTGAKPDGRHEGRASRQTGGHGGGGRTQGDRRGG